MSDTTVEIVDLAGAISYLQTLAGNITHTSDTELEIILAGLARVELEDDEVIGNIHTAREGLTAALVGVEAALAQLTGAHSSVAETVAAVGVDNVARDAAFYGAGV